MSERATAALASSLDETPFLVITWVGICAGMQRIERCRRRVFGDPSATSASSLGSDWTCPGHAGICRSYQRAA